MNAMLFALLLQLGGTGLTCQEKFYTTERHVSKWAFNDDTRITGNIASHITFDPGFHLNRMVRIQGEFFVQMPDTGKQLVIQGSVLGNITCLRGAEVDVLNYVEDSFSRVSVVRGDVVVGKEGKTISLSAGDVYQIDEGVESTFRMSTIETMRWTFGQTYTYNVPARVVFNLISRSFGARICLMDDKVRAPRFRTMWQQCEDTESVLNRLKSIGDIEFRKMDDNSYEIYSTDIIR